MADYTVSPPADAVLGALNLSSEGIIVYEPVADAHGIVSDMRISIMNDAAVRIFGVPRRVAIGALLSALWPMEQENESWTKGLEVLRTRQPYSYEWQTSGLGEARWFEVLLQEYDGNLAASYRDITERKIYLLRLEAQQSQLSGLLTAVPLGITVFEAVRNSSGEVVDLRLQHRNEIALRLSRIPEEMYTPGRLMSELMPKELYENFERMLDVVRMGKPLTHELYQPHLDKWILSRAHPHDDGVVSTIQDITDIKRFGHMKSRQAEMLTGVLEASPNGIAVCAAIRDLAGEVIDFKVVHANEQVIRISGYSREDYIGMTFLERLPEQASQIPALARLIAEQGSMQQEQYVAASGKWIIVTTTALGDGFVFTVQDITAQHRQQDEIMRSARTLEGVLQASPHAILVFEAIRHEGAVTDFRLIRFNQRATVTTALIAEELTNTTLFSCMPSARQRLPQYVAVMESGQQESYELFDDNLQLWRRITNTPLGSGFVMTMEDITEQRLVSRQIEESAQLLNAVLDSSPMAVVVYEAVRDNEHQIEDFRPLIANQQALVTSNYELEAFMASTLLQRHPGNSERLLGPLRDLIGKREPQVQEHFVSSSGRWVRSITTAFRDGFIATSQDITEQKEQSRIIEEQAELFNGVLKSLQNGLSILQIIRDDSGAMVDVQYIEVADSVLQSTGLSREETVGKSMRSLFPGIEETEYWKAYSNVARTGKPEHFEVHFTLQGFDNYLLNWVTPIGTDKLVSVYYIINDLKQAQRELEHTVFELRRSNEDLEQFASIASHDLQEPLRKVQSFGAMLESRYGEALGNEGRDLLTRMTNAASRMRNLVTGLLAFARLSGDEDVPLRAVDLNTLLAEIISDLDQTLDAGSSITLPRRLPFVSGIESQIRHLFHNLLTNALKFRKPEPEPQVSITFGPLEAEDAERLSPLANASSYVRLEVADNGIGFEPEFAEKIFGLFERLHGLNVYQGTGLGLSICRRVAERHGGTIWAESELGKGATFIVLLQKAP